MPIVACESATGLGQEPGTDLLVTGVVVTGVVVTGIVVTDVVVTGVVVTGVVATGVMLAVPRLRPVQPEVSTVTARAPNTGSPPFGLSWPAPEASRGCREGDVSATGGIDGL